MKTQDIINAIYNDFAAAYKNATPFVNSGALWNFCMDVIKDPVAISCIVFANDCGIPPVKSLLLIYKRTQNPAADFSFTAQESQYLGALMGFVFKFVLRYQAQQERCTVKELGVKTATRFFNRQADGESVGSLIKFEA